MTELISLKAKILIKMAYHVSVLSVIHYWDIFGINICNGCHDITQKSTSESYFVGWNDYRIYFKRMTKTEAVSRMENVDLSEQLWLWKNYYYEYLTSILLILLWNKN